MKRIAVTGASGFIGRHVIAAFAGEPVELVGVGRAQIDLHAPPPDVWAKLGHPDVVVHLAWGGLPAYRSLHHFERELPAQYRFLHDLVVAGLPTLVVAGTCFEYGMQSGELCESTPTFPSNPYAFAKDALRRQLEYLQSVHPFAFTWARLFYVYGEGQAESSLLPQLRRAATRGERVFRMSGGEQLRDYLPVTSAARAIATLACAGVDLGIVNICSGRPISVRNLVEAWIAEAGWSLELELGAYPYPDYEPLAFWGSNTKLTQLLGAVSTTSV